MEDTNRTASALSAFSLGLPAFVMVKIFTSSFYANDDTKTPMKIMFYSLLFNTLLNISLMIPFKNTGIAIGSSIASWYSVWLLNKYAQCKNNFKINTQTMRCIYKIVISASIMTVVLLILNYFCYDFYYSCNNLVKLFTLFLSITITALVYLLMLYFFKIHLLFY